ncbi:putative kinase-like protein TMKL1 [Macadamia integrifolia]|uniref:putative kinase-like protein TMKL1 n=1 Tax=Macadamia integrifolia TaxID=60698 RepID=UPI001C4EA28C|nr:putative kinase-like protein TMKL1 [Macadamia integrifolia]
MGLSLKLKIVIGLVPATLLIIGIIVIVYIVCRRRARSELLPQRKSSGRKEEDEVETEDLYSFPGGEDFTIHDILDAPGEVVGKSSYGTLYKATMERVNSVVLLRFLRPTCTGRVKEIHPVIKMLGFVRHPNLVPLQAFYAGPRGEKLFVHPFLSHGNLAQFIRDGNGELHKWAVIYRISLGIVKGLDHLHYGLQLPIIHGNLKSKNILLDEIHQPYVSDFGLHLLLNSSAGQEVLDVSAVQGYKAPEVMKMKETSKESDIYSLGVVLLEIITGKEAVDGNESPSPDLYLPNSMRNAILEHRISDMFNPNLLVNRSNDQNPITEEHLLMFFQLAMACCSPSPALRPDIKQVLRKLEELGN